MQAQGQRRAATAFLVAALAGVSALAQTASHDPEVVVPGYRTELEFEEGRGLAPKWVVQSVRLVQGLDDLRIHLRVENATRGYLDDTYFYGEVFDRSGRLCFTALFRLRQNLEFERGPLRPGGERTLESLSSDLAVATLPHSIRVYPAHRRRIGSADVFTAPVPIRVPVQWRNFAIPLPVPDWAQMRLGPLVGQNNAPVIDLAFAVADVDSSGGMSRMRVLDAKSEGVRQWIANLEPHLHFIPAMQDNIPQGGRALILFRTGPLRLFKPGEVQFAPEDTPSVKRFVSSLQGNEIPPVIVVELRKCTDWSDIGGGMASPPPASDCVEYFGDGTAWSLDIWEAALLPSSRGRSSERPGAENLDWHLISNFWTRYPGVLYSKPGR